MNKSKSSQVPEAPEHRRLSSRQVMRLSEYAKIDQKEIAGLTLAEASERLKWKIDPSRFLFREICGKVVKKDPVTGVEYPVPFATVYVEDTDCNLISYFPKPWPWGWFFPFNCRRETIATTKTDKCGNFCVRVPRFDIDWILQWRHERICFPIIFRRPSLGDLLDKLPPEVVGPWPPVPGPDPGPLDTLSRLPHSVIEAIGGKSAQRLAQRITKLQTNRTFGGVNQLHNELLNTRVFETELPPPLPGEFNRALAGQDKVVAAKGASARDGVRAAVALKLGLDPATKELAGFDPQRCIGPFMRCVDIMVPEWHTILDVPDITFRVTQDVNGDGTEENIYSEGYFDVRWDADPLPNVTLVASALAKESVVCGDQPQPKCTNVPALLMAGFMPLDDPGYFDGGIPAASIPPFPAKIGYAVRPNRPADSGSGRPPAQTPFCGVLQFYGCVEVGKAKYYRILQSTNGGKSYSAITGLAWNNYRNTGGTPIPINSDASGWYAIDPLDASNTPVPRQLLMYPNLLLHWPTPYLAQIILKLETGDGAKQHLAYSADVAIQGDNTTPTVQFSRWAWKFVGDDDSTLRDLWGIPCPTIRRGAVPRDIELVLEVTASAPHLRDASIYTYGCGSGAFVPYPTPEPSPPVNHPSHWHTNINDNATLLHQRYRLDHSALEGAYTFACLASSRAMNPSGADGGQLAPTLWNYDPVYIYTNPAIAVAVINGN